MHRLLKLTAAGTAAAGIAAALLLWGGTSGADDRVTPARLSEGESRTMAAQARQRAGADQRAAFDDGTVTAAEYEAAASRTLACVVEELGARAPGGVTVESTAPAWSADGSRLTYTYGFRRTEGAAAPADPSPVERRCQDRFLVQIERAYLVQFQGSARLDRVAADYRRCAAEAGIDLPSGDARLATAEYVERSKGDELPEALVRCLAERPVLLEDARGG